MEWLFSGEIWLALVTLIFLEIILGIDNLIFISLLSQKLPRHQQTKARLLGLSLAMIGRVALLFSISLVMGLTRPLFQVFGETFSGKDLVLLGGGLFLLAKATFEIHEQVDVSSREERTKYKVGTFANALTQIVLIDLVFSLDSVITAVGMTPHLSIMIISVMAAVFIMMAVAGRLAAFIDKNPTVKLLALSFLLLIGMVLVGEGLHFHIPKGYIYFAISFSIFVEMLNIRIRRRKTRRNVL